MNHLILQPILFMGLLSTVMMIWMYATRIPAAKVLEREGVDMQKLSHPAAVSGIFPSRVERIADNYNHLWEQPTLFYAIIFVIWAQGHTDNLHHQPLMAFIKSQFQLGFCYTYTPTGGSCGSRRHKRDYCTSPPLLGGG